MHKADDVERWLGHQLRAAARLRDLVDAQTKKVEARRAEDERQGSLANRHALLRPGQQLAQVFNKPTYYAASVCAAMTCTLGSFAKSRVVMSQTCHVWHRFASGTASDTLNADRQDTVSIYAN